MAVSSVLLAVLVVGVIYCLPALIAHNRKVVNRGTVTIISLLLGWTVLGYIIALAMAFGPTDTQTKAVNR